VSAASLPRKPEVCLTRGAGYYKKYGGYVPAATVYVAKDISSKQVLDEHEDVFLLAEVFFRNLVQERAT